MVYKFAKFGFIGIIGAAFVPTGGILDYFMIISAVFNTKLGYFWKGRGRPYDLFETERIQTPIVSPGLR